MQCNIITMTCLALLPSQKSFFSHYFHHSILTRFFPSGRSNHSLPVYINMRASLQVPPTPQLYQVHFSPTRISMPNYKLLFKIQVLQDTRPSTTMKQWLQYNQLNYYIHKPHQHAFFLVWEGHDISCLIPRGILDCSQSPHIRSR